MILKISIKETEQIFKKIKWLLLTLIIISCNNKKEQEKSKVLKIDQEKSKILSISFPDTVKLKKVIGGELKYDINNIGFNSDSISSRFLELLLSTSINKELANYNQIDNSRLLSYVDTIPTGKFSFKAVFEKKGKQTLNIVIRDNMFLKPDGKLPKDKMKLRTADYLFSKEVMVVD